ncbi:MAG TPA: hypothetical protein VFK32_00730, partial [Tepidiformaceae bacterium]|nr:hypothetical protein [Tepidiformaceae bacterium]
MNERFFTRRRVLALGGAAAVTAGTAVALTRGGSNSPRDASVRPTSSVPRALAVDIPPAFTPVDDAFETRTFAPGEPIDWAEGIFFLQVDGSAEGFRVNRALHDLWPAEPGRQPPYPSPYADRDFQAPLAEYDVVAGGEFVRARLWFPYEDCAVLLHRASGAAFTWEDNKLMVWPVGPYLMLISTEALRLERYFGQSDGYEALEYELVDAGLTRVRTGLVAAIGSTLADGTYNVAFDWSTDTLYYFAPGSQVDHRFVRVRASATTDPEDVPLASGMESIYARPRGATATVGTLNDRKTIV